MAVHAAASSGEIKAIELLLRKGASVNMWCEPAVTQLQEVIFKGHYEAVEILLRNGAHVNAPAAKHITALEAAYRGG